MRQPFFVQHGEDYSLYLDVELKSCRIVSLLPAATEIAATLGLTDEIVGVSHECDYPAETNVCPRVTHCPMHGAGLTSGEVDEWVRRALRENGTIYTIDEPLLAPAPARCHPHTKIVRCLRGRLWHSRAAGRNVARSAARRELGALEVVGHFRRHSTCRRSVRRVASRGRSDRTITGPCGGGAAPRKPHCKSPALFFDGMGGSAVLFRSLGTRTGRDRGRTGSVRSQASTLNADRLAGSARRSSGNHRARPLRLRY